MKLKKNENEELLKKKIYNAIESYIVENGYAPSIRDLSNICNIPSTTLFKYTKRLQADGKIKMKPGVARSIVILKN